jgi:hypothetical protein
LSEGKSKALEGISKSLQSPAFAQIAGQKRSNLPIIMLFPLKKSFTRLSLKDGRD